MDRFIKSKRLKQRRAYDIFGSTTLDQISLHTSRKNGETKRARCRRLARWTIRAQCMVVKKLGAERRKLPSEMQRGASRPVRLMVEDITLSM